MKKFLVAIVACVGLSVFADEIADSIRARLSSAVADNKPAEAAQWASALASYNSSIKAAEEAKTCATGNQVLGVYKNLYYSVPAVLEGIEAYMRLNNMPDDCEDMQSLKVIKLVYKATQGQLKDEDTKAMAKSVFDAEKAQRERWEKRHVN